MKKITSQQQRVLDCIQIYLNKTGFPPTRADICKELGFKSPNSAETHLRALEKKGFISIESGTSRGISIINNDKFFIAASHQSMFETFYLQTIFNSPVFILKKELLLIPIFGWYLKKIGSISIKRDKVTKDNLSFFNDISKMMATSNRPLIIFPQGTRVLPDERPPFKKGASRIYEQLNVTCQPVAINSGYVWPKKGEKKSNKTITISILKPIPAGLTKDNFIQILEKNFY